MVYSASDDPVDPSANINPTAHGMPRTVRSKCQRAEKGGAELHSRTSEVPLETASEDAASPDRFVRLDEVKHRVGLGKSMIYRLIGEGKFPAPYKLSPLASRWSDREISSWIDDVKDGFEGKKRKF